MLILVQKVRKLALIGAYANMTKLIVFSADALDDIVQRNMIEIRKYGFGEELTDSEGLNWTGIQFWQVVKQLANSNMVSILTYHSFPIAVN